MDTHEDFLGRIRYPGYHDRIMSAEKAAEFIKPEMTLGVCWTYLTEHRDNRYFDKQ